MQSSNKSAMLRDCINRNSQAFLPMDSVEEYHNFLEDQAEVNMRGMSRILNASAQGVITFPYPAACIRSNYKQDFVQKPRPKVSFFNLDRERKYGRP